MAAAAAPTASTATVPGRNRPTVSYFTYFNAHGALMPVESDLATDPFGSQDLDVGFERIGKEFGGGADSLYRRG